jgi:hypothetical protein
MKWPLLSALMACALIAVPAHAQTPARAPRVALFCEPGFPAVDAVPPDCAALARALDAFDVRVLDASALGTLRPRDADVLVMPYGSAFPMAAWSGIAGFLEAGGHLVNGGGVPFAAPVGRIVGGWLASARTTSFHRQLGIVQAFPVAAETLSYSPIGPSDDVAMLARDASARRIYELIVRFTTTKAFPDEDGSDGPREARLAALVHGVAGGTALAAPYVQIDRLEGRFAGGRWLLATGDLGASPQAIAAMVTRARAGASEFTAQPRFAGFHPGEPIQVTVSWRRPGREAAAAGLPPCVVDLLDEQGRVVATTTATLTAEPAVPSRASADVRLPVDSTTLARGLYQVRASWPRGPTAVSGLWIYDAAMVSGGQGLAVGRDYFSREGIAFPVAGTTYMASDVHRRFLLEPDAWLWQRDFAAMAGAGVNMVRTGIWTGWSLHSEPDGRPTEATLRALEVFLLTARRHQVPVVFTFFAFVPTTWGPGNPYFAPSALDAQKRFVGGIAGRLAGANDIAWDLINEPSFSSPARLWQCRPNYDSDEQAAWQAWLAGTPVTGETPVPQLQTPVPQLLTPTREARLLERWGALPGEGFGLPSLQDFGDKNLFGTTRPNKAADYKRFAQQAFAGWVKEMTASIRANGNRTQLVTVGQDEGGASERPNPLVYGAAIDFTGTHTWWNNDALLWDALVSKLPDRPALVGETGLMTYERPDGSAWRTEEDARNLLERKMALSLAAGGAGFIQWLWNSNVTMPIDNEAGIGFLRDDGTAKPELESFTRVARFVRDHGARFVDRTLEDVAIVVPLSQVFSVRDLATAATQRAVRAFEYDLRTPVRVLSEFATADVRKGARLLVVPSPRILTGEAWDALLAAVEQGSTVLVTGPFDRDEYERTVTRSAALGLTVVTRPVAPEHWLSVDDAEVAVPFRGPKLERAERAVINGVDRATVRVIARGKGRVVWCPLPVELSDDERATVAVYRMALRAAGVTAPLVIEATLPSGVLVRPVVFRDAVLIVVSNETDRDASVQVRLPGVATPVTIPVEAERARMVLVDRRTGKVVGGM